MPMIPVDTAVQLIVGPLIDDTDFKSLETGVAYNAAGMSVDLIKSSISGTPTKTDLTLTTAGSQDWVELGNGMYYIEVTAAQNNVEGELQLVGVATGIAPFISAKYQVVPSTVFNSLVAGSDTLPVDIIQWLGTAAATPTTAGVPEVDVTHVAGTAQTANDNGADINAIKVKTDYLPSATAGAAGGVFIAGTNAATVVTGSLTTTFTGNLTGSVDSVTNAVGSVTGEVTADVTKWAGTALAARDTEGYPVITVKSGTGSGEVALTGGVALVNADVNWLSGSYAAAENLRAQYDGSGYAGGTIKIKVDVDEIKNDATAATNLSKSARAIIFGAAATGTLSTTTCTTDLTGYANDELVGAAIIFYGAAGNAGCRATITGYALTNGQVTFSGGVETAPVNGDTFVIV